MWSLPTGTSEDVNCRPNCMTLVAASDNGNNVCINGNSMITCQLNDVNPRASYCGSECKLQQTITEVSNNINTSLFIGPTPATFSRIFTTVLLVESIAKNCLYKFEHTYCI